MAKPRANMKLSSFSGIAPAQPSPVEQATEPPSLKNEEAQKFKLKPETTINIRLLTEQHDWLSSMARQIRQSNTSPVPPSERVFPTHLIGVAVDLLRHTDIDWSEIKTEEDLRRLLGLPN